jgi:F1F0 ATPase subunit 2
VTEPGAATALGLAVLAGAGIGAVYFGTLWLVVRRLPRVAWPGVWLGVTAILRLLLALGLFALLVGGRWERLLAALAGFVAARLVLTRRLGLPGGGPPRAAGAARAGRGGRG